MRHRKRMNSGRSREELKGVKEQETIIRIFYVRKISVFNKRGRRNIEKTAPLCPTGEDEILEQMFKINIYHP